MIKHLSASSIGMFQRCQQQWYFRYIEGIKSPPNVAMAKGTGVHKSAELNYLDVIEGKEPQTIGEVQQNASEGFESAIVDIETWEQPKGEALDQVVTAAETYHKTYGVTVKPLSAERFCEIDNPGWRWPVIGFIDLETDTHIWDIKVTGKKKPSSEVEKSLQSRIYRRMIPGKEFGYHNIVLAKHIRAETITSDFVAEDNKIDGYIGAMQDGIMSSMETGIFTPAAADSWSCSSRFCGYWNICEHGGK